MMSNLKQKDLRTSQPNCELKEGKDFECMRHSRYKSLEVKLGRFYQPISVAGE